MQEEAEETFRQYFKNTGYNIPFKKLLAYNKKIKNDEYYSRNISL